MPEKISITQAKNHLTANVHSVETGPAIQITRRGRPVAMLVLIQSIRDAAVYKPKKPGQVKIKTGFRCLKNPKKIAT